MLWIGTSESGQRQVTGTSTELVTTDQPVKRQRQLLLSNR